MVERHGLIKGQLYGVPDIYELKNLGRENTHLLEYLCDTQELTYIDNQKNISSIPEKTYLGCIRNDPSKSWMRNELRRWRIQLKGVDNRTDIQFHYGKDFGWSDGCIILTGKATPLMCTKEENSPESAIKAVKDFYEGNQNQSYPIKAGCSVVTAQVKVI